MRKTKEIHRSLSPKMRVVLFEHYILNESNLLKSQCTLNDLDCVIETNSEHYSKDVGRRKIARYKIKSRSCINLGQKMNFNRLLGSIKNYKQEAILNVLNNEKLLTKIKNYLTINFTRNEEQFFLDQQKKYVTFLLIDKRNLHEKISSIYNDIKIISEKNNPLIERFLIILKFSLRKYIFILETLFKCRIKSKTQNEKDYINTTNRLKENIIIKHKYNHNAISPYMTTDKKLFISWIKNNPKYIVSTFNELMNQMHLFFKIESTKIAIKQKKTTYSLPYICRLCERKIEPARIEKHSRKCLEICNKKNHLRNWNRNKMSKLQKDAMDTKSYLNNTLNKKRSSIFTNSVKNNSKFIKKTTNKKQSNYRHSITVMKNNFDTMSNKNEPENYRTIGKVVNKSFFSTNQCNNIRKGSDSLENTIENDMQDMSNSNVGLLHVNSQDVYALSDKITLGESIKKNDPVDSDQKKDLLDSEVMIPNLNGDKKKLVHRLSGLNKVDFVRGTSICSDKLFENQSNKTISPNSSTSKRQKTELEPFQWESTTPKSKALDINKRNLQIRKLSSYGDIQINTRSMKSTSQKMIYSPKKNTVKKKLSKFSQANEIENIKKLKGSRELIVKIIKYIEEVCMNPILIDNMEEEYKIFDLIKNYSEIDDVEEDDSTLESSTFEFVNRFLEVIEERIEILHKISNLQKNDEKNLYKEITKKYLKVRASKSVTNLDIVRVNTLKSRINDSVIRRKISIEEKNESLKSSSIRNSFDFNQNILINANEEISLVKNKSIKTENSDDNKKTTKITCNNNNSCTKEIKLNISSFGKESLKEKINEKKAKIDSNEESNIYSMSIKKLDFGDKELSDISDTKSEEVYIEKFKKNDSIEVVVQNKKVYNPENNESSSESESDEELIDVGNLKNKFSNIKNVKPKLVHQNSIVMMKKSSFFKDVPKFVSPNVYKNEQLNNSMSSFLDEKDDFLKIRKSMNNSLQKSDSEKFLTISQLGKKPICTIKSNIWSNKKNKNFSFKNKNPYISDYTNKYVCLERLCNEVNNDTCMLRKTSINDSDENPKLGFNISNDLLYVKNKNDSMQEILPQPSISKYSTLGKSKQLKELSDESPELLTLSSKKMLSLENVFQKFDNFQLSKKNNLVEKICRKPYFEEDNENLYSENCSVEGWIEVDYVRETQSDSEIVYQSRIESEQLKTKNTIQQSDFKVIKPIGQGAYGKVYLVKRKITNDYYAMKFIKLSKDIDQASLEEVINEINVLQILTGELVVKAMFAFRHKNYLVCVMQYMWGGDFEGYLEEIGRFEDDVDLRYYTAEMVLALDHLHKQGISHRDLKPANIMIGKNGHLKQGDFGLSKLGTNGVKINSSITLELKNKDLVSSLVIEKSLNSEVQFLSIILEQIQDKSNKSTKNNGIKTSQIPTKTSFKSIKKSLINKPNNLAVGTIDYMAPEIVILQSKDPNKKRFNVKEITGSQNDNKMIQAVDWWALGCIIYECIVGISPFNDDTEEKVIQNILEGNIDWPDIGYGEDEMNPETQEIVKKFLEKDPKKRLGSKGIDEITTHLFFKSIDFEKVSSMQPPWIPSGPSSLTPQLKSDVKLENELEISSPQGPLRQKLLNEADFNIQRLDLLHDINLKNLEDYKAEKSKINSRIKIVDNLLITTKNIECLLISF